MTIKRCQITGAYNCCAVVGFDYVKMTYFGYTKRECERLFRAVVRKAKGK